MPARESLSGPGAPGNARMLHLTGIRKSYRISPVETEVLRGVDFQAGAGDFVSIMGPSGSGKTTLMNIIGLLDRPTSGTYFLNGQDVSRMRDDRLSHMRNRHIGFVFQSFQLLPQLTALENICLPLVYRGARRPEMKRRAQAILERVGMNHRAGHRPDQLSGGQKQRIAIARALAGDPAVLLADEPTGALDTDTAADIMELLVETNRSHGVTILIITHDPAVARGCIRQVRIRDGRISESHSRNPPCGAVEGEGPVVETGAQARAAVQGAGGPNRGKWPE